MNDILDFQSSPSCRDVPLQFIADSVTQDSSSNRSEYRQFSISNIGMIRIHKRVGFNIVGMEVAKCDGRIHRYDVFGHIDLRHNFCEIQVCLQFIEAIGAANESGNV